MIYHFWIKKVTADIGYLRSDIAERETRLIKWMVGLGFLFAGIAIAGETYPLRDFE